MFLISELIRIRLIPTIARIYLTKEKSIPSLARRTGWRSDTIFAYQHDPV